MKTIKFRAFVNQEGMDVPEMHYFKLGQGFSGMDSCPIMQFTGIKDKNGKEIYEGDVIEATEALFGERAHIKSKAVVRFEDGAFKVASVNLSIVAITETNGLSFDPEIIGNIYENPELLK